MTAAATTLAQGWLLDDDARFQPERRLRLRVECYTLSNSIAQGNPGWADPNNGFVEWVGENTLRAELTWNRFRIGTAAQERVVGWFLYCWLPVRVGYTIWERPVGIIWRSEGLVPDVRAELTAYLWNNGVGYWEKIPFAARADVVAGVDMLGVGAELAAGVICIKRIRYSPDVDVLGFAPSIELRLRLGTYAFDLSGAE